jgi:hypothetical protein
LPSSTQIIITNNWREEMAYQPKSIMDVWDIIRRWHERQGIREISRATGFDRKTIKSYKRLAESAGLSVDEPLQTVLYLEKLVRAYHQELRDRADYD